MNEIEKEEQQLKEYWQLRDQRMLADREIINIVKAERKSNKIQWYSNEPKVFYETACALISSYPARYRLPLTINFTPEEKDKMNKAERLLLGIWRSIDKRNMDKGMTYWLRELAYWTLSGWYAGFVNVRKGDRGVEFIADLWDPINVYPEWDSDGLITCVRSFEVDKITAQAMMVEWSKKGLIGEIHDDKRGIVRVTNYWKNDRGKVYNAIQLNGRDIKSLTLEKKFDQIPIFIGTVGIPERTSSDWVTRVGDNIIAANRDIYEYENTMISLMATIMAETAYPNIISKTQTGQPAIKAEEFKGYGEVVPIKLNETVDLLKHAATPAEVETLIKWAANHKQKGSLPDIVYGGVPVELSGFAISQLMAAIKYKIAPYLNTMQYVISQMSSKLLYQYRENKYPKITLSTTNPREIRKGMFFVEEFNWKDVPESIFVEVTIPITSAMDRTQQIIFARQALQPPQLISRETLWDDILDIQDSEQEYARILQDEMLELPVVKQIAMIEQLRIRKDAYRASGRIAEAEALNRYIMMLEMQLGMRQGIPTKAGGISPEAMPPEAIESPDRNRAAAGLTPSGVYRRPQTTEERAESQGRKGTLVSPTGQVLL